MKSAVEVKVSLIKIFEVKVISLPPSGIVPEFSPVFVFQIDAFEIKRKVENLLLTLTKRFV